MSTPELDSDMPELPRSPELRPIPTENPPKRTKTNRTQDYDTRPVKISLQAKEGTKGIEKSAFNPTNPLSASSVYKKRPLPEFTDVLDALYYARSVIVQASNIAEDHEVSTKLLDFLNVFRDFTEKGYTTYQTQLENQVQSLGSTMNKLSKRLVAQPPPTSQPKAPKSYAQTAKSDQSTISLQTLKTKPKPKTTTIKDQQIVLIRSTNETFHPFKLRDEINDAFQNAHIYNPVIRSIQKSHRSDNIIITTMPEYSGQWLLDNKELWEELISFDRIQTNQAWYKVCVHGIPLANYQSGEDFIHDVPQEIKVFNSGLQIVGNPFWLTSKTKRESGYQYSGSACIAFATEAQAKQAVSSGLYIAGENRKVEKMLSVPPSTQCRNCQRYGHQETRCEDPAACQYCGKDHHTRLHSCSECRTKGRPCKHTILKCFNCKEHHASNDKTCTAFLATKNQAIHDFTPSSDDAEEISMADTHLLV